jgi:tetratricopeptide (TPR) repeat protein
VNYLLERKVITRNEYYASSIEELFNDYFLPESSVGLLELAGLHYLNDALYKYDGEEYQAAFEQIKKAYFLYPSERMMLLFHFILAGAINDADFLKEENAWLLVYLSRLPDESINPDEVASGYMILTERILFNSSLTEYYDDFFYLLDAEMEDGLVKNVISFHYYFLRGKSLMVQYRFKEALDLFTRAYEINPGNLELQSLLISTIAANLENMPAEVLVNDLEQYARDLPVLSENGMFVSLQLMSYLMWVEQLYDFGEIERAQRTLNKFESLYRQNPGVDVDYEHVGDAYSAAAVYYFKHYNKDEAIRYLQKGLEIAPENYELRYRLKSLKTP